MSDTTTSPRDELRALVQSIVDFEFSRPGNQMTKNILIDKYVFEIEAFIEAHDATRERADPFPFAETYDFLYNNHKDVLEELEEHLATLTNPKQQTGEK